MKTLIMIMTLIALGSTTFWQPLKGLNRGDDCACWRQGAVSDGFGGCTRSGSCCTTTQPCFPVQDKCRCGPVTSGGEFPSHDVGCARRCELPANLDLKVEAQVQLHLDAAVSACNNLAILDLLSDVKLDATANILINNILNLKAKADSELLAHDGIYSTVLAAVQAELGSGCYQNLEDARVRAFAVVDTDANVELCNGLKAVVDLSAKYRASLYKYYKEHLLDSILSANVSGYVAAQAVVRSKFVNCIAQRIYNNRGLLGVLISASLNTILDVNAKVEVDLSGAICLLRSILYRLYALGHCGRDFDLWIDVDLKLHADLASKLDANANAFVAIGDNYATLASLKTDLKLQANIEHLALAIRCALKRTAAVTIHYVSETSTEIKFRVECFLERKVDELEAEFQARVAQVKAAIHLAFRAVARVQKTKVRVDADAIVTASSSGVRAYAYSSAEILVPHIVTLFD
eukprot:TRINITY_DN1918_c0_g1_i1.p1 TRINITY_DN1918_c0_g1~~TRINITY_DN1918_c0_g1_i1.p1  ORF type:complete len:462 (+),score=90.11 TRINITY_DN1918_c0_g1_i1:59-1444(+)